MDNESKKGVWRKVIDPVLKYWQPFFTIGTLIFASGTLSADIKNIKSKMDKVEITELQQAQMTEEIKTLNKNQDKQSEAIGKLTDSVNTLGQVLARMEGRQETQNKKQK